MYTAWKRASKLPIRKEVLELVKREHQSKQEVFQHLNIKTNDNRAEVNASEDDGDEVLITNIPTKRPNSSSPIGIDVVFEIDTSLLTQSAENFAIMPRTPTTTEFTYNLPALDFSIISKPTDVNLDLCKSIQEEVWQYVSKISPTETVNKHSNQCQCQTLLMSSVSMKSQKFEF